MKYNYVIFGSDDMMYRISYSDLEKVSYARYLWKPIDTDSRVLTNLYRFHTSPKTNRFVVLPFKNMWNSWIFRGEFENENPVCYIFFAGRTKILNKHFLSYLRKKDNKCKLVIFCQDLIAQSLRNKYDELKEEFDLKLSFDHEDAVKHDMVYYPLVYSDWKVPQNSNIKKSDVYFLGKAKNRFNEIIDAYEVLTGAGLNCDFYISGVDKSQEVYPEHIHYIKSMPYVENLQHVISSDYLLEIMQKNGHGFTIRYCEAIMYGKRMITNNPEIDKAEFYSEDKIVVFKDSLKDSLQRILCNRGSVDYHYKERLSPINLLKFIDNML